MPLYTRIAVDMGDNVTVAKFGAFLSKISEQDLLIPAARANEKLSIKDSDTTLGDVIARAGLVVDDKAASAE